MTLSPRLLSSSSAASEAVDSASRRTPYEQLQADYTSLQNDHEKLQQDYNDLETRHQQHLNEYEQLQEAFVAIAEELAQLRQGSPSSNKSERTSSSSDGFLETVLVPLALSIRKKDNIDKKQHEDVIAFMRRNPECKSYKEAQYRMGRR